MDYFNSSKFDYYSNFTRRLIMIIWENIVNFNLENFSTLAELIKYLQKHEKLYKKDYKALRVMGHGAYESLEGMKEIDVPQTDKNDEDFELYLKLKAKYEKL